MNRIKIFIPVVAIIIVSLIAVQRIRVNSFIASVEETNTLGVKNESKNFDSSSCDFTTLQNGSTVLSLFDESGNLNSILIDTINSAPSFIKKEVENNIQKEFDKALNCEALTQSQIDNAKNALQII